jgi:predicted nucleic acid-binding protein
VILDTNGRSALAEGEPALESVLRRAAQIAIPVIVLGEYRYGFSHMPQHSLPLLSRDRHFDAVSGIIRIDW